MEIGIVGEWVQGAAIFLSPSAHAPEAHTPSATRRRTVPRQNLSLTRHRPPSCRNMHASGATSDGDRNVAAPCAPPLHTFAPASPALSAPPCGLTSNHAHGATGRPVEHPRGPAQPSASTARPPRGTAPPKAARRPGAGRSGRRARTASGRTSGRRRGMRAWTP